MYNVFIVVVIDFNLGSLLLVFLFIVLNMSCVLFKFILEEVLCGVMEYVVSVFGLNDRGVVDIGNVVDFILWDIEIFVEFVYCINGYCLIVVFKDGKYV